MGSECTQADLATRIIVDTAHGSTAFGSVAGTGRPHAS